MPQFETESIVLKSFSLGEADRIAVFLTREHGMIRGVARGAKRLKSRFGSTLEPFSTVNLSYFHKEDRDLVSIQTIELIRSRFDEASDPGFLQTFSYIAELLIAFAPPHDPNETLYRMVRACVDTPVGSNFDLAAIALYSELWLLKLGGVLPDWSHCRECSRVFAPDEVAELYSTFALCCLPCSKAGRDRKVLPLDRDIFRSVIAMPPGAFVEFAAAYPDAVAKVSAVMKRIAAQIIGRETVGAKSLAVRL